MQNAEREEESGKPAEAMALREEHWAGSTWATTPEERAPRARTRDLRLTIFEAVDEWNNDFLPGVNKEGINNWVWGDPKYTLYGFLDEPQGTHGITRTMFKGNGI